MTFRSFSLFNNSGLYLISFLLLLSCSTNTNENQISGTRSEEKNNEDSSATRDSSISDFETMLKDKYLLIDTIRDSTGIKTVTFNPAADYNCGDLTGDGFDDYLVVLDYMGGPTSGVFYNGKTYKQLSKEGMIISRPGVEIKHRVIDVNCEDQINEVIVFTGGGGTLGNYYDCEIYRYDEDMKEMKPIFTETISAYEWNESSPGQRKLQVNYIEVIYTQDSCINEFEVSDGIDVNEEDNYDIEIEPFLNNSRKVYVFDVEKNEFVRKKYPL